MSAAHPGCEILAHTPFGRVTRLRRFSFASAAGGRSALRLLRSRFTATRKVC